MYKSGDNFGKEFFYYRDNNGVTRNDYRLTSIDAILGRLNTIKKKLREIGAPPHDVANFTIVVW